MPGWTGLANARVTIFGDTYQLPPDMQVGGTQADRGRWWKGTCRWSGGQRNAKGRGGGTGGGGVEGGARGCIAGSFVPLHGAQVCVWCQAAENRLLSVAGHVGLRPGVRCTWQGSEAPGASCGAVRRYTPLPLLARCHLEAPIPLFRVVLRCFHSPSSPASSATPVPHPTRCALASSIPSGFTFFSLPPHHTPTRPPRSRFSWTSMAVRTAGCRATLCTSA